METLKKEEKAHKKWLSKQGRRGDEEEDEEDPDAVAHYEQMLQRMPQQQRVSLRSMQLKRGGLTKKIGSWSDKEVNAPRTPSQDVDMIRDKVPSARGPMAKRDGSSLVAIAAATDRPSYHGRLRWIQCAHAYPWLHGILPRA